MPREWPSRWSAREPSARCTCPRRWSSPPSPAEEQGLVGSAHLAHLARAEGWQLEAVLNNDIVGGNTTPGDMLQLKDRVRVFSEGVPVAATPEQARRIRGLGEENDSPSRQLARAVTDAVHTYFASTTNSPFLAFPVARPDRYGRGGDHSSFNREGFAAVRFTEWREDFHHQHQNVVRPQPGSSDPVLGDLPEFVDFNYVAKVARLNAAVLATLAASPGEPAAVAIDAQKLENGTTLRWDGGSREGGSLRGSVAGDHRFRLAIRAGCCTAGGRRSHHRHAASIQGQRDLRGAGGGRSRPSQPGGRTRTTRAIVRSRTRMRAAQ